MGGTRAMRCAVGSSVTGRSADECVSRSDQDEIVRERGQEGACRTTMHVNGRARCAEGKQRQRLCSEDCGRDRKRLANGVNSGLCVASCRGSVIKAGVGLGEMGTPDEADRPKSRSGVG